MKRFLFFIIFLLHVSNAQALIVGSNDAVSRNTFTIFPAADDNNEIRGFALMDEGFELEDFTTSCIYNAVEQVRKNIYLNGGALFLATNLFLENIATFTNMGDIKSSDSEIRKVNLAANTKILGVETQGPITFENIDLHLNNIVTFQAELHCQEKCRINGKGFTLTLANGGNLVVNKNSQLVLKNIMIDGVEGTNIRCIDDSASIVLDNVRWVLHDLYTFTHGGFQFKNKCKFIGPYTFAYQSVATSTILEDSVLILDPNLTFSYDPADQNRNLLHFTDESSELTFNGSSFITTSSGIELTTGLLRVKRTSNIGSDPDVNLFFQRGFSIGDGATDMNVVINPEAQLYVTQGVLEYHNLFPESLLMLNNLSAIRIGTGAVLQLFEDIDVQPGFVVFDSSSFLFSKLGQTTIIGSINPQGPVIRRNFTP